MERRKAEFRVGGRCWSSCSRRSHGDALRTQRAGRGTQAGNRICQEGAQCGAHGRKPRSHACRGDIGRESRVLCVDETYQLAVKLCRS